MFFPTTISQITRWDGCSSTESSPGHCANTVVIPGVIVARWSFSALFSAGWVWAQFRQRDLDGRVLVLSFSLCSLRDLTVLVPVASWLRFRKCLYEVRPANQQVKAWRQSKSGFGTPRWLCHWPHGSPQLCETTFRLGNCADFRLCLFGCYNAQPKWLGNLVSMTTLCMHCQPWPHRSITTAATEAAAATFWIAGTLSSVLAVLLRDIETPCQSALMRLPYLW